MTRRPDSLVTADLAGTWSLVELDVLASSSQVQLDAARNVGELSVAADGSFQTSEGMTAMFPEADGRVRVPLGAETLYFDISPAKDFMVGIARSADGNAYLRLLAKETTTAADSQFSGEWRNNTLRLEAVTGRDYSRITTTNRLVNLASDKAYRVDGTSAGSWSVVTGPLRLVLDPVDEPVNTEFSLNSSVNLALDATAPPGGPIVDFSMLVKSPDSLGVSFLAGNWGLTKFSIRYAGDSPLAWYTNYHSGGPISEVFQARRVDGLLIKDGRYETYDESSRLTLWGVYSNDRRRAATNFFYFGTSTATNSILESTFDAAGGLVLEITRNFRTNGLLQDFHRQLYFTNAVLAESVQFELFGNGQTNQYMASSYRSDGSRISSLSFSSFTNGIVESWSQSAYATNGNLATMTNYNRRSDGSLELTSSLDNSEPGGASRGPRVSSGWNDFEVCLAISGRQTGRAPGSGICQWPHRLPSRLRVQPAARRLAGMAQ